MNTDHVLEEVGQQFSVTRERIRQIEAKALERAASNLNRHCQRSEVIHPERFGHWIASSLRSSQ